MQAALSIPPGVIGEAFMQQLAPSSDDLEPLNRKFIGHCLGIPIQSYGEQKETTLGNYLEVQGGYVGSSGASLDTFVVHGTSSRIANEYYSIISDDEKWVELATDHFGIARLANSANSQNGLIARVKILMQEDNFVKRKRHQELYEAIFLNVKVEHYAFSPGNRGKHTGCPVNRMPEQNLQDFLTCGPAVSPHAESDSLAGDTNTASMDTSEEEVNAERQIPDITTQAATPAPTAYLNAAEYPYTGSSRRASSRRVSPRRSSISSRSVSPPTRQYIRQLQVSLPGSSPSNEEGAQAATRRPLTSSSYPGRTPARQVSPTGINRSQESGRPPGRPGATAQTESIRVPFDWFHFPQCVSSWVPLIMMALSSHNEVPNLHEQVLRDEAWKAQESKPTHQSFHGKYFRPHSQDLLPKKTSPSDDPLFPSSATDQPQFVSFFPYL